MGDKSSVHLCAYNAIKALTLAGDSSIKMKHLVPLTNSQKHFLERYRLRAFSCEVAAIISGHPWNKALLFGKV